MQLLAETISIIAEIELQTLIKMCVTCRFLSSKYFSAPLLLLLFGIDAFQVIYFMSQERLQTVNQDGGLRVRIVSWCRPATWYN